VWCSFLGASIRGCGTCGLHGICSIERTSELKKRTDTCSAYSGGNQCVVAAPVAYTGVLALHDSGEISTDKLLAARQRWGINPWMRHMWPTRHCWHCTTVADMKTYICGQSVSSRE
jgi:hypothetical protein